MCEISPISNEYYYNSKRTQETKNSGFADIMLKALEDTAAKVIKESAAGTLEKDILNTEMPTKIYYGNSMLRNLTGMEKASSAQYMNALYNNNLCMGSLGMSNPYLGGGYMNNLFGYSLNGINSSLGYQFVNAMLSTILGRAGSMDIGA